MRISDWSSRVLFRSGRGSNGENGAKDRADARRPAEREGESEHVGRDRAPARHRGLDAQIAHHPQRADETDEEKPEEDDDGAADDVQLIAIGEKQLAERRGAGTQHHEDGGKTEHKAEAEPDRRPERKSTRM